MTNLEAWNKWKISSTTPNYSKDFLVNPSIESSDSERYNPLKLKDKGGEHNEGVHSFGRKRGDGTLDKPLAIIQALYKKGLLNTETVISIEKKYGRLD